MTDNVDMVAVREWLDTAPEGVVSVQVDLANGTSETVVLKED